MASGLFGSGAQVGPLTQTRIQPTGIPGSTFVQAPRREAGGNLRALADALGGLNTALQNFAGVQKQQEDDPQSRANKEWVAKRQQMSADQLREEARNGTPDGNRVREDALNSMLGERANDDFRRKWLEYYNTEFDRTSGDAAAEYERMRQEHAEGLPSEIARGNFYRLTGDHRRAWMEKDTEEKVEYVKQELNTTVVDSFRNSIDDAINIHGKTPQEAAEIVFAKSASNRDFLGLSGQEQNDTLFRIAEEYALQGNEDVARALLEGTRKGADGRELPSLRKSHGYTDKVIRLLEQSGNIRDSKAKEDSLDAQIGANDLVTSGAFTKEEAEKRRGLGVWSDVELGNMVDSSNRNREAIETKALNAAQRRELRAASERAETSVYSQAYEQMNRLGGINKLRDIEIPNASGEGSTTISAQRQIDEVIEMKEEDFETHQEKLISGGMDEASARDATNRLRVDWYAGNGITNDDWSNTLNGIAGRATTDTLLQKGEVSSYLQNSAKLYRQLKATNPAYLSSLLTNSASKDFLETFDLAVSQRRIPEEEALAYAAQWTSQPESVKAKSMVDQREAEKLADSVLGDLGVDERSFNRSYVLDRVATLSKHGATTGEIKKRLEQDILETSVPVNGVLVFANNDLPKDFPELMDLEIQKRFADYGKRYGIEDPSDLYLVADAAESKWYVRSKSMPGLIVGASPITPRDLEGRREVKRSEREKLIRKMTTAKDEERVELKRQYDEQTASEKQRIRYWRDLASKRKGVRQSLAGAIADKLQSNHDERVAGEAGEWKRQHKILEDGIRASQKKADERQRKNLEWLRSLMPSVKVGNTTLIK